VESSPEALFVFLEEKVVLANGAAGRLLCASSPNLLFGRNARKIVSPAHFETASRQLRAADDEECELRVAEQEFVRLDGGVVSVEVSAMPFLYMGRQAFQWVARDVTERKRVQETIRTQNEYLTALSETAIGLVRRLDIESVLTAILARAAALIDAPNWFLFLYNGEEDLLELQVAAGVYRKILGLRLRPGERFAGKVFQGGRPLIVADYHNWPDRFSDPGLDAIRSVAGVPLRLDSELIGVIGLGYFEVVTSLGEETLDLLHRFGKLASVALYNARLYERLQNELAERRRVETELTRAKEFAEAANRAKSGFLATMSHELRTPLNAVIGFTELIKDGHVGPLNDLQREYLGDVHTSGRHLLSLINDILDLSKIESGKMELQPVPVNLGELIGKSLVMVREKAARHNIELLADMDGIADMTISVDERKFKQIIYNLLSNAVKFTPDGGKVGVSAVRPPQARAIEIAVSDSGIGIDAASIEKIFNPFEQADDSLSRKYAGTGLGLALTRKLVELHGGRIWAESGGANLGAVFRFTLPL
jgi:PAS domain S-box-containing protein